MLTVFGVLERRMALFNAASNLCMELLVTYILGKDGVHKHMSSTARLAWWQICDCTQTSLCIFA